MAQNVDLSNLEELLMTTTAEELEELQQYLTEDSTTNSYICDKQPTGPLDIDKLRKHMELTAKNEEDWPELVPHIGKNKSINKKEDPQTSADFSKAEFSELDETIREALAECDADDFAELAAILGLHGVTSQLETAKAPAFYSSKLKIFDEELRNETNVKESIEKLNQNPEEMKELNLNNIQDTSTEDLNELFSALKTNKNLKVLSMSATSLSSKFVRPLAEALLVNKTLQKLDLSSNFLSGSSIVNIMKAVNQNCTLRELRLCNQCPLNLGTKAENELLELMMRNDTLRVLSADFSVPTVRYAIQKKLQENSFNSRKKK